MSKLIFDQIDGKIMREGEAFAMTADELKGFLTMYEYLSNQVNIAKEAMIAKIIQDIEGRLATVEDGLNFRFVSRVGHPEEEMVYYKNEFIGRFTVDGKGYSVTVTFTP